MLQVYKVSDRAIQMDWGGKPPGSSRSGQLADLRHLLQAYGQGAGWPAFQVVLADQSLSLVFRQAPQVTDFIPNLVSSLPVLVEKLFGRVRADNVADTTPVATQKPLQPQTPSRYHRVPVQYGGAAGPDLDWLAAQTGLSTQAVIDLHCSAVYTVQFLGFLPGFAYLSGLPGVLQFPRRSQPRARVPAGTLAIGAEYCAVYPWESPGGWHLIGHVEQCMFDPNESDDIGQSFFQAGDVVQFIRADHA